MTRIFCVLTMVAMSALVQIKPQQNTGSVSGRVIDADTTLPIPGAKVGSQKLGWTITDDNGRYTMRGLAPGRVSIEMDYEAGANLDDIPAIPQDVTVIGGRDVPGIDFRVWLDATISGHVYDANNEPVAGIPVTVFYRRYIDGGSSTGTYENTDTLINNTVSRLNTTTDDRGIYAVRSSFLRGGRSFWILAAAERIYGNPVSDAPSATESRKKAWLPTYFPNATSLSSATPVVLHSLEHRENVDIHIASGSSYCIDATLKAAGKPARIHYALEEEPLSAMYSGTGIPRKGGESGDDGKIRVCDLHTGEYQLTAFGNGLPGVVDFFGSVPVNVGNADVHNVVVAAEPPVKLSVEVVWDTAPANGPLTMVRVNAIPGFRLPLTPLPSASIPGETSFLVLPSLRTGVEISGLQPPLFVKDILFDGTSVLHKNFVPQTTSSKLQIRIGRDGGTLTAQVNRVDGKAAGGSAVLLIPLTAMTEADLANSIITGTTDEYGKYEAANIPPGKYYVLATDSPPPSRILRPAMLHIEKSPENLQRLLRVRTQGPLVEVVPEIHTQVQLIPKDLGK